MPNNVLLGIIAGLLFLIVLLELDARRRRASKGGRNKQRKPDSKPRDSRKGMSSPRASNEHSPNRQPSKPSGLLSSLAFWRKEVEEKPPELPVELIPSADSVDRDRLAEARTLPGFVDASWILFAALSRHCEMLTLQCRRHCVAVRYLADGVWHDGKMIEPDLAQSAMTALRAVCGMDTTRPASGVRGQFTALFRGNQYKATMVSQQRQGAEAMAIQFSGPAASLASLDEVGLRTDLQTALQKLMDTGSGILLLSALPGSGLRTTTQVVLHRCDRFVREMFIVEDEANRCSAVEAAEVRTYSSARGENAVSLFSDIFDMEPGIVVLRDLPDARTVDSLCAHLDSKKCLVVSTVRARDCVEALARILLLGVDQPAFARHVTAVLNQRLIRKLCSACKEPFDPPRAILDALGIPPGTAAEFSQPPRQPDVVCPECGGLGYRGRTALFELLLADDGVRRALTSRPSLRTIQQAVLQTGSLSLRQEGVLLVRSGVTSPQELLRVLDAGSGSREGAAAKAPAHAGS